MIGWVFNNFYKVSASGCYLLNTRYPCYPAIESEADDFCSFIVEEFEVCICKWKRGRLGTLISRITPNRRIAPNHRRPTRSNLPINKWVKKLWKVWISWPQAGNCFKSLKMIFQMRFPHLYLSFFMFHWGKTVSLVLSSMKFALGDSWCYRSPYQTFLRISGARVKHKKWSLQHSSAHIEYNTFSLF